MYIRRGEIEDKSKIIELWKYCFNNDSQSFLDHYFSNIYSPKNTLVALENEKITTSIQLNPYFFNFKGNNIETKYFVGMSSFPQARGSGSVKELFQYSFKQLYEDKMPFVFLMGIDYGLYTPFGFTNILDKYILRGKTKDLYQKTKKDYDFKEISKDSSAEEIKKLTVFFKKTVKKNYSSHIIRKEENFKNNLGELSSDNGFAYYLEKNNEIYGYVFYYFDKEKIVVKEMLYKDTEVLKEILKFIYNHNTQFSEFEIRDDFFKTTNHFLINPREINSEIMPFLMARIINLKEFLSSTSIHLDIKNELRLEIKDNLIKENNILCVLKEGTINYIENYAKFDYELSIDISLLAPLFFGYLNKVEGLLLTHLYSSLNDEKKDMFFDLFKEKKNIFFNEYV